MYTNAEIYMRLQVLELFSSGDCAAVINVKNRNMIMKLSKRTNNEQVVWHERGVY